MMSSISELATWCVSCWLIYGDRGNVSMSLPAVRNSG